MTPEQSVAEKTMTHTRGPWTASRGRCDDEDQAWFEVRGMDRLPHSEHLIERGVATCFDGSFGNAEANARLIAAAPTMLDALREVVDVLDDYADVNDGDDGLPRPNKAMSALTLVNEAIAKAEAQS